jgi:hypothetical protein
MLQLSPNAPVAALTAPPDWHGGAVAAGLGFYCTTFPWFLLAAEQVGFGRSVALRHRPQGT